MEPLRYELRHLRVGGITSFIICSLLFSLKSEGVDHRKGWTLGFGEELQDQGCLVHERGRYMDQFIYIRSLGVTTSCES